ncbi:2-hydroxyacid dehydrogenase [Pedobacter gandavensis]|uniref:D-glycerate dehydrogenase n=1 Tax=Pedobacter gandavensis TaxID=2679963 RepID=A0ABR6F2X3_9SPHI|nr:D-glycerate dehydrogenase [Pedobacter gandavensis]MBB2151837.1 D-glycerate dehydrogenase [Pedobacter gandavensis]
MKVFITRVIPEEGRKLLEEAGIEIQEWKEKRALTQEELIANCLESDALLSVGTRLDADFLQACSHLKVIALHSVGFDHVDVDTATSLNIPIGNTPGVLSAATADTAFLLMLATSRKAFYLHKSIEKGQWGFFDPTANLGVELRGKTLGVFGLGKIGLEMARCCKAAFGMKIIYHNRTRNEAAEQALNAKWLSFEELLQQSDVLTVHTALTPETEGKFDWAAFNLMKPSAIFINTARGAIHQEEDLLKALLAGKIWGAGLDVTNPEPMRPDHPLLQMPNVSVLPHIGSATQETRAAMSVLAAKNVIAGLKGAEIPFLVNPEVYTTKS